MPALKHVTRRWLKSPVRRLARQYRRATWRSRSLPDFVIIGAQKSGTTSLYHYLRQHPQLFPSYAKEVHFFDGGLDPGVDSFERGQAWYSSHFPRRTKIRPQGKTFEASPLYIFHPLAPGRIHDLVPQVKMIAVLRNPTERAISHYFHTKRRNTEPLPILEALQEEEKRLGPVVKANDFKNDIFIHHSYKSRGLYRRQLERYLDYFPRQRLLVINSGELFSAPHDTLRRVFEFIGVDARFEVKDLKPRNVAGNRSDVAPEVYEYLNSFFRPHNQALYAQVGEDYGW